MKKNHFLNIGIVTTALTLASAIAFASTTMQYDSPTFLPNDQSYSPFVYPLMYFKTQNDRPYDFIWNMYCINENYTAYIDSGSSTGIASNYVSGGSGVNGSVAEPYINQYYVSAPKSVVGSNYDVMQFAFNKINDIGSNVNTVKVYFGESQTGTQTVQDFFKKTKPNALTTIKGESSAGWSSLNSHAKLFLTDNNSDTFVSVMGSVNLQTVEMSSKANNALRFVENSEMPTSGNTTTLYQYFNALSQSIVSGSALTPFQAYSNGTSSNSGSGVLPSVNIGTNDRYNVTFYAGVGDLFSGGKDYDETTSTSSDDKFPGYLSPPLAGQYKEGEINWYDQVIYNAAEQLRQGNDVTLDIAMFEIGEYNRFTNNLFNFVKYGFASPSTLSNTEFSTEDKTSSTTVSTPFPGKLTVNFLWQSQDDSSSAKSTTTYQLLHQNSPSYCFTVSGSSNISGSGTYTMNVSPIWPVYDSSTKFKTYDQDTTQDMHNKFVIMYVPSNPSANTLYVSSSNLDKPGKDGGALWQVGVVIRPQSGSSTWSGSEMTENSLFANYINYFNLLSQTSVESLGVKNAYKGQRDFAELIFPDVLNGSINWIETVPYDGSYKTKMSEGIDSFFFPVPISTSGTFTPIGS